MSHCVRGLGSLNRDNLYGTAAAATDGGTAATLTGSILNNDSVMIGSDSHSTTPIDFYNGLLDDVRIYNRALSTDEIKRLYKIGATAKLGLAAANDSLANGLVGWWNFDGKTISGTRVLDTSGQGNYGTMTNGPTLVNGKQGQGLSFDGNNQYVSVGNINNDVYAISLWFKSNKLIHSGSGGENYMFQTTAGGYAGINLGDSTANLSNEIIEIRSLTGGQNGSGWCSSTATISTDWHHLTAAWDGDKYAIYLDGIRRDNCHYGTRAVISGSLRGCPETKALKNKILCHVLGKTKNGITGSAVSCHALARYNYLIY